MCISLLRLVRFCTWWTGRTACLFRTVPVALTRAAQLRSNTVQNSSCCYIVNVHNHPPWAMSRKEGMAWYSISRPMPSLWAECFQPQRNKRDYMRRERTGSVMSVFAEGAEQLMQKRHLWSCLFSDVLYICLVLTLRLINMESANILQGDLAKLFNFCLVYIFSSKNWPWWNFSYKEFLSTKD